MSRMQDRGIVFGSMHVCLRDCAVVFVAACCWLFAIAICLIQRGESAIDFSLVSFNSVAFLVGVVVGVSASFAAVVSFVETVG